MILEELSLKDFRSYSQKEFKFRTNSTLLVGENAVGKTNLLEAIYLLATGKSFRAQKGEEMIRYGRDLSRLRAKIKNTEGEENLEIVLTTGEILGKKVPKKRYLVNGIPRRMMDFVGNLRVVYFGPEDLKIILNSPSIRREWLDYVLEQADKEYRRANLSYQKGLRQRNKLLEQIREQGKPRGVLFFWDKLLIENGEIISKKREEFIDFINSQPDYFGQINIVYDRSVISPQRLERYVDKEIAAGMTLIGPHRDDFDVKIKKEGKERSLHIFGSRGEQRTAIFSLKLAELEFMFEKTKERPLLLLDDIFSELDSHRRERLLEVIPKQQTILSTADINLIEKEHLKKLDVVKLKVS